MENKEHKRDKIFDNNHGSNDGDGSSISFNVNSAYSDEQNKEERIDLEIIYGKIDALIKESKFQKFNIPNSKGDYKKLNKVEINEVYSFVSKELKEYPKIEIFSVLSEYFDIAFTKFYESLSNKFKSDLVTELENRGSFKQYFLKNIGNKLF